MKNILIICFSIILILNSSLPVFAQEYQVSNSILRAEDVQALREFYNSTGGGKDPKRYKWDFWEVKGGIWVHEASYTRNSLTFALNATRYYTCKDPSDPNGKDVTCQEKEYKVIGLEFKDGGYKLQGTLPNSIGKLKDLQKLVIKNEIGLTGPIPESIGELKNLLNLELSSGFSGQIPSSIGNLTKLETLRLIAPYTGNIPLTIEKLNNLKILEIRYTQLTGGIPAGIGNLGNLEELLLEYNLLSGSIPQSIGQLKKLRHLNLQNNLLTGDIPKNIGQLKNLLYLQLGNLKLTGQIPTEIGDLESLEALDLAFNQLTGVIPESIGNLTALKSLGLFANEFYNNTKTNNSFTGKIPTSIGNLVNLRTLMLYDNNFTGEIPATIGRLVNLEYIDLNNNGLTGKAPESLNNLRKLKKLFLSNNKLIGPLPTLNNFRDITDLWIHSNKFNFDGFEEINTKYNFYYGQQDSLVISDNDSTLSVYAGGTLKNNTYTWFLNKQLTKTVTGDSTFKPQQEGRYYVTVSNSVLPNFKLAGKEIYFRPKSALVVSIIDPNPTMITSDGAVSNNLALNDPTHQVDAAATDGVTKLLLRVESNDPLTFETLKSKNGSLSALGSQESKQQKIFVNPVQSHNGKKVCLVVYTVPDGYGLEFGEGGREAAIKVTSTKDTAITRTAKIRLVSPPVVLVHGMWSNPQAWLGPDGLAMYLGKNKFGNVQVADYSDNNYSTFHPNQIGSGVNSVYRSSIEAILEYRKAKIACTQVDVVAHSLGGLMTRSFIQQDYYKNQLNLKKGYVHKLITIGTPHQGSPLGPLLYENSESLLYLKPSVLSMLFLTYGDVLSWINQPIGSCHRDFDPGSEAFRKLEQTPVKAHAITGNYMPANTTFSFWLDKLMFILYFKRHQDLFKKDPNDVIVSVDSQKGGLTGKGLSPTFPNTTHSGPASDTTETNSKKIYARIIGLLAADERDSELNSYFNDHFPRYNHPVTGRLTAQPGQSGQGESRPNARVKSNKTEAIEFASSVRGATYSLAGSTQVKLEFKATGGAKPIHSIILVQDVGGYEVPASPPYAVTFTLPKNTPVGRLNIVAIARDSADLLLADTTHINIAPGVGVNNFGVQPQKVSLDSLFRKAPLYVSGTFVVGKDSVYANLTRLGSGVSYKPRSGNAVVKVDSNGVITALRAGSEIVEVKYGNQVKNIEVIVSPNFAQAHYRHNAITFDLIENKTINDDPFGLLASAASGEPVNFTVVSGPATLSKSILTLTGVGTVTIRATQAGNVYYNAAPPVMRTFQVTSALGIEDELARAVKVYPNPASMYFSVELPANLRQATLRLISARGDVVTEVKAAGKEKVIVPTHGFARGLYVLSLSSDYAVVNKKIVLR